MYYIVCEAHLFDGEKKEQRRNNLLDVLLISRLSFEESLALFLVVTSVFKRGANNISVDFCCCCGRWYSLYAADKTTNNRKNCESNNLFDTTQNTIIPHDCSIISSNNNKYVDRYKWCDTDGRTHTHTLSRSISLARSLTHSFTHYRLYQPDGRVCDIVCVSVRVLDWITICCFSISALLHRTAYILIFSVLCRFLF